MNRLRASIAAVFLAFAPACTLLFDAGTFATVAGDSSAPATEGLSDATTESAAVVLDADAQDSDSSAQRNDLDRTLYPADASYWERAASGNGHGYFVVNASGRIDWPLARAAAARVPRGHLATFETFEEYLFVKGVVAAVASAFVVRQLKRLGPWVGLERIAPGYVKLGWVTDAPYVHDTREWLSGEPNDEPPGEPYVAFLGFTTSSQIALHDAIAAEDINAYVVEVE
jgi:hypothetical protein